MFTLLRVHMAAGRCSWEEIPADMGGMGGRGLAAAILAREMPPECEPLGPQNKLIFSPGLLGATAALPQGRLAIGAKSPVTGRLKSALVGSLAAGHLSRLGILGVIIEQQAPPERWLQLEIRQGQARLTPSPLTGLGSLAALFRLEQLHGGDCARITIGPAGEMRLPLANMAFSGPRGIRHAGQDGLGAVMGAMGLKSVLVFPTEDDQDRALADPEAFRLAANRLAAALAELSAKARQGRTGAAGQTARNAPPLSAASENTPPAGKGCWQGCGLCGPTLAARSKKHREKSAAYHALWQPLENHAQDALRARFDHLCNDLGLDAFAVSAAAHAAVERGELAQGDGAALVRALEQLGGDGALRGLPDKGAVFFEPVPHSGEAASHTARADTAFADAMGLCAFAARAVLGSPNARTAITEQVTARYGWRLPEDYVLALGPRILALEEAFNSQGGTGQAPA